MEKDSAHAVYRILDLLWNDRRHAERREGRITPDALQEELVEVERQRIHDADTGHVVSKSHVCVPVTSLHRQAPVFADGKRSADEDVESKIDGGDRDQVAGGEERDDEEQGVHKIVHDRHDG